MCGMSDLSSCIPVSQAYNYHYAAGLFFIFFLMHSYRTITYTNNNFIRLALAVITVSVQFMTSTNSPDTAPGEGRFLVYHLLLSMLTEFNHEK